MLKKKIPIRSHTGEFRKTNSNNKKYLVEDFDHRCAYCDDLDKISGGYDSYHVEHFAPKEKFSELKFMYDNLLYACPYCNRCKNDDWPSDDPKVSVVDNKGYVDPCTKEYYNHLDRNEMTGNIIFKTELGEYMYNKMKLYLRRHAIIYMLDKLSLKRGELKKSIDKDKEHDKNTEEKEAILRSIDDEFFKYYYEYNDEQST